VLHRVVALADRPVGGRPDQTPPHEYIVPLPELLSEIAGVGPTSKRVQQLYAQLLAAHGPELRILRQLDPDSLQSTPLAQAIRNLRAGHVTRIAGYDGIHGTIHALP
jgi:PHP family Zn ribbon phosphoesterase